MKLGLVDIKMLLYIMNKNETKVVKFKPVTYLAWLGPDVMGGWDSTAFK